MHAATFEKSARLQAVVNCMLAWNRPMTTAEIQNATGSMAVHSDIAEIRAQADRLGLVIPPAEYAGKSESGRKIYRYKIHKT